MSVVANGSEPHTAGVLQRSSDAAILPIDAPAALDWGHETDLGFIAGLRDLDCGDCPGPGHESDTDRFASRVYSRKGRVGGAQRMAKSLPDPLGPRRMPANGRPMVADVSRAARWRLPRTGFRVSGGPAMRAKRWKLGATRFPDALLPSQHGRYNTRFSAHATGCEQALR